MNLYIEKKGNGLPLVLLHGWGFDHKIWLPLLPYLVTKYSFYLVDLPGFGRSDLMEWDDFKAELLKQLPEQFAILGWSMGGLFATRLAIEKPERVTHLINVASSPYFIKTANWPGIEKSVFNDFFRHLSSAPEETIIKFIQLQLKDQPYEYSEQFLPDSTSLQAGLQVLQTWDLREDLQQLKKPACFMFGRLDAIIPRHTMSFMEKMYPDFSYVMFAKAAHMPFFSHQNEFINALENVFL